MRTRRRVRAWHMVKFCPPAPCSNHQAVAVADYTLECGHVVRLRHFGPAAHRVKAGTSVIPPAGWDCPLCGRGGVC
jgi:hypothetical protein